MSRITLVYDRATGKMVPKTAMCRTPPGPSIISDIQDVRSMLDGKVYSSRRHYRDSVKAHGCEIVGNDLNDQPMDRPMVDTPGLRDDIARAIGERS